MHEAQQHAIQIPVGTNAVNYGHWSPSSGLASVLVDETQQTEAKLVAKLQQFLSIPGAGGEEVQIYFVTPKGAPGTPLEQAFARQRFHTVFSQSQPNVDFWY